MHLALPHLSLVLSLLSAAVTPCCLAASFASLLRTFACAREQERVSGSTYSMVGALNKIPIAIIGFAFFNSPTTQLGADDGVAGRMGGSRGRRGVGVGVGRSVDKIRWLELVS